MKAYERIRLRLEEAIRQGRYPTQTLLPHLDSLAGEFSCSVGTIRRAMVDLKQTGVVEAVRKRGTLVLRRPARGRIPVLLSSDMHTNSLFQQPICTALGAADYDVDILAPDVGVAMFRNWCVRLQHDPRPPLALVVLGGDRLHQEHPEVAAIAEEHFLHQVWIEIDGMGDQVGETRSCITTDWRAEAFCLAEHLRDLGHRHIAIWAGIQHCDMDRNTMVAEQVRDLFAMAGGTCLTHYGEDGFDGIITQVAEGRLTAYIDLNDHSAGRSLSRFQGAGLRVPEDVSLVGRHDTPWATSTEPPLTSLSLSPERTAEIVLRAVADFAESQAGSLYTVPPAMISRNSTAPPPAR